MSISRDIPNIFFMSNDDILTNFFQSKDKNGLSGKYVQVRTWSELEFVDVSKFISMYGNNIDVFLGANCSKMLPKDFNMIKTLFFDGSRYSVDVLRRLNAIRDWQECPDINLSGIDLKNHSWDFGAFLYTIYGVVCSYVSSEVTSEVEDFSTTSEEMVGTDGYDSDVMITKYVVESIKGILNRLVPNVKDTGLTVVIDMKRWFPAFCSKYEIVEEILKSRKFDGCYIRLTNRSAGFSSSLGIKRNSLYKYNDGCIRRERMAS